MKEIEKIVQRYQNTDWQIEKVALGTVVRVEESAYRRIGARMYVSDNGEWIGGISGGCLEGDALKRAKIAISKNESSVVVYDTMDDDTHQIGIGLGCNGRIDVMFTPIDKGDKDNPIEQLKEITNARQPNILIQVIHANNKSKDIRGRIYRESEIARMSKHLSIQFDTLNTWRDKVYELKKSKIAEVSSETGDKYELLFEFVRPKIRLICVGDNYDVNALISIAHELGWEIHVAGKVHKLSKHVFQNAKSVCTTDDVRNITIDEYTAIILMSHDYKTDLELLKYYMDVDVPYLGLLGPKKRMIKMEMELRNADPTIDLSTKDNIHAPIGLDIGAEDPEEIALSIAAEIIAMQRQRDGRPLRKRSGPIHERD